MDSKSPAFENFFQHKVKDLILSSNISLKRRFTTQRIPQREIETKGEDAYVVKELPMTLVKSLF
jgi:hypothetical protein